MLVGTKTLPDGTVITHEVHLTGKDHFVDDQFQETNVHSGVIMPVATTMRLPAPTDLLSQ